MKEPLLTIVTVTYNAGKVLERTLLSVRLAIENLPDPDGVQYLLLDGASSDNTLDIAYLYRESLSLEISSEKDRGIYDAMNKGIRLAKGRYIWFLNAGDEVHDSGVIRRLFRAMENDADVYYSDALFVSPDGYTRGLRSEVTPHSLGDTLTWKDMAMGMKVCHQAFIAKTKIVPGYDIGNLSADLDWEINVLKRSSVITRLDFVLCKYLTGGVSTQRHRESLTDRWKVLVAHFGWGVTLVNHFLIVIRGVVFLLNRGKYW